MLILRDRKLLNNGMSIISNKKALQYIFEQGDLPNHIKVKNSHDARLYEKRYNTKIITSNTEDIDIECDSSYDIEAFEKLVTRLFEYKRDDISDLAHVTRFEQELSYFIENNQQHLLLKIDDLVTEFKEDNIVWGVGRGSSVASYIMFLLEAHDVNSIKYDINFSEFSKEDSDAKY